MEMCAPLFFGEPRSTAHPLTLATGALLLCSALQGAPAAAAEPDKPTAEQVLFWEAKKALRTGNQARFQRYADKLRDYPLYPYLIYWRLKRHLAQTLPLTVEAFLQQYAELPVTPLLRRRWLHHLAREGRWEEYLAFYEESDDPALRCHYHYAQHKQGNDAAAWEGAKALWLVGHSQDAACDPLFAAWKKAGGISREFYWQRLERVMENGNLELASHLARSLDRHDREPLRLWQRAYRKPDVLRSKPLREDNALNRRILFHTLRHRAAKAPRGTAALWRELAPRYAFTPAQHNAINRAIAIGLTYANDADALNWFARLPTALRDIEVCNHALRVALRTGRWGDALAWLEVMPGDENRSPRSLYWRGRIYEQMGFTGTARHFYQAISGQRSYYGFLAADRLDQPYNLHDTPLQVSEEAFARVAARPAMVRARELYRLGLTASARREWKQAIATMAREQLLAASKLADQWGWSDRALLTLAKADHFDDLTIRFPLEFNQTVQKEARRRALDPAWVYAVVRQESAMMPYVQSPVGALGLMQLMPQTGRAIARQLQLGQPNRRQLLKPETNIRFGSYYLRQVLQEFDDNPVLATAAYNAGPHRIRRWYPKHGAMAADLWVDTIPFDETRHYVRQVLAYAVFYDQRLEQPVKRLKERMPPVSHKTGLSHCDGCAAADTRLAQAPRSH
jgi:soluble lytic murein transglycosylase